MTALTDRFSCAVDYARIAHAAQFRKGSHIPYIYHLLGVASLVIEFGGSEDQAIAGLLHDTLEDCGASHEAAIREQFGDAVADIVKDCTDGTAEGKASHTDPEAKRRDWIER
jgi:(p)ppGpp synthase/HD superfamily hydrolase